MSEVIINKVREAYKVFEEKLTLAVSLLPQQDQIGIVRLTSLDGYNLTHPRGVFGLIFNGTNYSKDENVRGGSLIMKEDILIGVVSIIRFIDNSFISVDKFDMMPADYVELAVDAISGIEVFNKRPQFENKIYPIRAELVDEDKGVWKYLTTFSVPVDFVEKSLRE